MAQSAKMFSEFMAKGMIVKGEKVPEWFRLSEQATPETMKRIASIVSAVDLPLQVKNLPMQAHWFVLDSLLLANKANRDGMHAIALALTRQSIEAISVVEIGICKHKNASALLTKWEQDEVTSGALRKWLSVNVWPAYGCGLWTESWADFMSKLARAIQPYAHYSSMLSKWQIRLHDGKSEENSFIVEWAPRAYDPQKATRITLYHAILTFTLARIWIAHSSTDDAEFVALINRLRIALGKSKYLDGHETNWDQQFLPFMWSSDGRTILE